MRAEEDTDRVDDGDVESGPPVRTLRLGAVAMLMAVAFGGGYLARAAAGPADPPAPIQPGVSVEETAPPLDETQLRGGLPSGHPPIGGASSAPAGPPQTGEATPLRSVSPTATP